MVCDNAAIAPANARNAAATATRLLGHIIGRLPSTTEYENICNAASGQCACARSIADVHARNIPALNWMLYACARHARMRRPIRGRLATLMPRRRASDWEFHKHDGRYLRLPRHHCANVQRISIALKGHGPCAQVIQQRNT